MQKTVNTNPKVEIHTSMQNVSIYHTKLLAYLTLLPWNGLMLQPLFLKFPVAYTPALLVYLDGNGLLDMNEISLLLESELEKKYESHSVLHIKDSQEVRQAVTEEDRQAGRQTGIQRRRQAGRESSREAGSTGGPVIMQVFRLADRKA